MIRTAIILASVPFGDDPSSQRFLLIRYGHTDYTKGQERGGFDFTEADADAVIRDFADRGKDLVVDYDHQTVTGGEAPASGWIKNLEKGEDGLYATAEWTPKAAERLKGREYRYHSPVIFFDGKGHPSALHSVALTNHPAFHGYPALVADDGDGDNHIDPNPNNNNQGANMNYLLKIAALIGVTAAFDDGKEDEAKLAQAIADKLNELKAMVDNGAAFLKAHGANTFDDVAGMIAGMKPAADVEKLQNELSALKARDLVAQAFTDGKLVEAQRKWAEEYAAKNPEGFKAFCDAAQKVAPGAASTVPAGGKPAKTEAEPFSDADWKIFENCGVKKEDLNTKKKED